MGGFAIALLVVTHRASFHCRCLRTSATFFVRPTMAMLCAPPQVEEPLQNVGADPSQSWVPAFQDQSLHRVHGVGLIVDAGFGVVVTFAHWQIWLRPRCWRFQSSGYRKTRRPRSTTGAVSFRFKCSACATCSTALWSLAQAIAWSARVRRRSRRESSKR